MNALAKVALASLGGYATIVLYAKMTGGLGVGPRMAGSSSPEAIARWEGERWRRAMVWPRDLLPHPK
jgi:hypothetical protein